MKSDPNETKPPKAAAAPADEVPPTMKEAAAEAVSETPEVSSDSTDNEPAATHGERIKRARPDKHQQTERKKQDAKVRSGRAENARGKDKSTEAPDQQTGRERDASANEASLQSRLLAQPKLDGIALNRELLPPALLAALDGAGLGSREFLPSAAFTFLAAIGASAGPNVRFDPGRPSTGMATKDQCHDANGISLRVVLMAPDRQFSCVAPALLAAAYAVGNDELDRWRVATDREAAHRHASAYRKRLHDQAVINSTLLGIAPPAPWIEELSVKSGPRPHFVLRNAASSAILTAAAGGTGLLLVDDRAMPSMSSVGSNFDRDTDRLLNAWSLGLDVSVEDPVSGRTSMRCPPAGVIGVLAEPEWCSLYKATGRQLEATIFAAAAPPPIVSDASNLASLLRKVGIMAVEPIQLRLSAKSEQVLASAAVSWAALPSSYLPPLADYYAGLSDLARRIAIAFHLAATAGDDKQLHPEIATSTVKRAVSLVDDFVVPMARSALEPVSTVQVERDARRIVAYLREHTSDANSIFDRRRLVTAWQRSMSVAALDAAICLLCDQGLLIPLDKADGNGGQRFNVAALVYSST